MNKRALKEFAVYARNELRSQIALRAQAFGITPKGSSALITGTDYVEINGQKLPLSYKNGLQKLLKEIELKGYDQVIEEVAYTWFNRLVAIRFMEVHNYLPSKVRVLSSETKGKVDPDILTDYQYTDLPVDQEEITSLLQQGKREEAYRKLLIAQCNELHDIMPFLFERLNDYTELLLPESLLHADSLIHKLGKELDDENFAQVEVIGWLYQYYISEKKDEVFAGLRQNKKITKENIPAATQLFTPHWIVRYMVENSLGHMWIESHPESNLKAEMKYYVEPAEQEPDVQAKLAELRNPNLSPEDITVLDPACGSGHILVYAFDLLYKIYEERGYPARDIPFLILEKNLYGIDIDDRAAQLAAFALMMKAREKTKKVFRIRPKLHVIVIQESNDIFIDQAAELIGENETEKAEMKKLLETFIDAKNYGSILSPEKVDFDKYLWKIERLRQDGEYTLDAFEVYEQLNKIEKIIEQAKMLASQYDVVVMNPPYMGNRGMNLKLKKYLNDHYPKGKNDLFAVFMIRAQHFIVENGFSAAINQHSWMFLSRFEGLRKEFLSNITICSMIHLGTRTFEEVGGEVVQSTCFVFRGALIPGYKGKYIRLVDYLSPSEKEKMFVCKKKNDVFIANQESFNNVPSSSIIYWVSDNVRKILKENQKTSEICEIRVGLDTGDNDYFIKHWYEVEFSNIGFSHKSIIDFHDSRKIWVPHTKGGSYRKWYGNNEFVLRFDKESFNILSNQGNKLPSKQFYFLEGASWSRVSNYFAVSNYSPRC
ncbi:BREX-1 system adenine-specific DNA-methyltransferase PglX [Geobacillus thermoleovorans]|uniref:BREX-1 system adenine-specific DNA-methyltransferase PglX n=1 Tax=Geobacillus thermoleovorans TaxID=33941 RepID=UPI00345C4CB6